MKKTKTSRDRLSELPDSLIFKIFEFLATKDVVRTQILSQRWVNLWTQTPYLHFDSASWNNNDDQFRNFIHRCILSWRGSRVLKFKVSVAVFVKSLSSDMNLWVRFAVDNGVQDLDISFSKVHYDPYKDEYCVPKCLYSCPSLQNLSFLGEINGNMNISSVMDWNRLKTLRLRCFWITQAAIDLVLSKCPVLEVFILSFIDKNNNLRLSFRSNTLKELELYNRSKLRGSPDDVSMDTEVKISTPNLEKLSFTGLGYAKCLLKNVSSLTRAKIGFRKNDFLSDTLTQILPTIQRVERLALSGCCIKVLLGNGRLLSPMPSVTFLSISGSFEEHEGMVGLLETFPKLKALVVREDSKYIDPNSKKKKFKPNPSESFLVELRTVEVTWTMHDLLILPLVKTVLKYASKLEKLVFRVKRTAVSPSAASSTTSTMLSESQTKLLRMKRSSPNAKLIFCEY